MYAGIYSQMSGAAAFPEEHRAVTTQKTTHKSKRIAVPVPFGRERHRESLPSLHCCVKYSKADVVVCRLQYKTRTLQVAKSGFKRRYRAI